ncbi:probable rho2-gtp binding protein rho2 [Phaffia rhodozyma]|uniref:Probable rho2-gtp binding protein rho2 n=1 Tax=Phaffia rhodozyma TaxID=264483 RepID=A0A0F7SXW2_PHARH|nr:probable rho2-gtp binding protein rho2 [Phaffia rhodozyma]
MHVDHTDKLLFLCFFSNLFPRIDPARGLTIGDGACGKTSLLCVFSLGEFPKEYEPTIFENYVAEIQLDGKPVQLALWDTAGQEEYERLRPLSYSKAHVILIAFAIDTPDSLENVSVKWIEEVRNICGFHIPVLLVGCKSDLRDNAPEPERSDPNRFVQTADALRTLQALSIRSYHECSSLANIGVDDVFEAATRVSMLVRDDPSGPGAGAGAGSGSGSAGGTDRRRHDDRREKDGGCCVIL